MPAPVERAFTYAILLSALRCTMQYVVLPFVLPWIGVVAEVPAWVTLALAGAGALLARAQRAHPGRMRHAQRWSYLALAFVVFAALVLFVTMDLQQPWGSGGQQEQQRGGGRIERPPPFCYSLWSCRS